MNFSTCNPNRERVIPKKRGRGRPRSKSKPKSEPKQKEKCLLDPINKLVKEILT